jgi:hypothetical protein
MGARIYFRTSDLGSHGLAQVAAIGRDRSLAQPWADRSPWSRRTGLVPGPVGQENDGPKSVIHPFLLP